MGILSNIGEVLCRSEMKNIMAGNALNTAPACCKKGSMSDCNCCWLGLWSCSGVECEEDYECKMVSTHGSNPCAACTC